MVSRLISFGFKMAQRRFRRGRNFTGKYYRNTSPKRHRPIRWITPLKYKNVSFMRHHAPSFNAFPFLQIGTVKAWCVPIFLVQSPKVNSYLGKRYSLKCWPLRFTYKAPSLIRPVPYRWGIRVLLYISFHCKPVSFHPQESVDRLF